VKSLIGLGKSVPEHKDFFQALNNRLSVQSVKHGPWKMGPVRSSAKSIYDDFTRLAVVWREEL
jgi:hypothetical protein